MMTRPRPATRRRWPGTSQSRAAVVFLAPAAIVLGVFVLWPMLRAGYLSFTEYNLLRDPEWVGVQNYVDLANDEAFWNALRNTAVYATVATVVTVALAILIAVLLNTRFPLRGFARASVFLPYITSLSVVAIAWSFLFNPQIGLFAYWGSAVGISSGQGWLRDPNLAMWAVIIVGVWKMVGFYAVIYLAGLQSIPQELYESASLDGAGPIRRLVSITLPLLGNQTLLVVVLATITNVQVFDQVYVMTGGGPYFRTETLVSLIYRVGFGDLQFGYASAISWVLVVVLLAISAVQFFYFRRRTVNF